MARNGANLATKRELITGVFSVEVENKRLGDGIVRFVYLDESGIGDARKEPFVVVAGVIVNADTQLHAVESRLRDMAVKYAHPSLQKFTHFHAKELFRGGKIFDRQTYSDDLRWNILQEICEIPREFDLPVVMGFTRREAYKAAPFRITWNANELNVGAQTAAATACLFAIEKYMRQTVAGEVAALIYENNDVPNMKTGIRDVQRLLGDADFTKIVGNDVFGDELAQYLPLTKIVESPLFSKKNESSVLQVADALAWALNRKLRAAPECDRFFQPINSQLIVRPRTF